VKVLIIGANGFIGNSLSQYLEDSELDVIRGTRQLYGDLCSFNDWADLLDDVDVVINLAARVHQMNEVPCDLIEKKYETINNEFPNNLLKLCDKYGVKKLIQFSTIKVLGEYSERPFLETDEFNPSDLYSQSKVNMEIGLKDISKSLNVEVSVVRIPLVYGVGVGANFRKLLNLVNLSLPLPFGGLVHKRSMLYTGNINDFVLKVVEANLTNRFNVFHLADKHSYSTCDLVQRIKKVYKSKALIFSLSPKLLDLGFRLIGKGEIISRLNSSLELSIDASCRALDWSPCYTLEQGLKEIRQRENLD
tara:strand:+ start:659 stop:1573 length:915 start_codon:yes stop_codon:yes gene_type:complete